jgi:hypothetical protein
MVSIRSGYEHGRVVVLENPGVTNKKLGLLA